MAPELLFWLISANMPGKAGLLPDVDVETLGVHCPVSSCPAHSDSTDEYAFFSETLNHCNAHIAGR